MVKVCAKLVELQEVRAHCTQMSCLIFVITVSNKNILTRSISMTFISNKITDLKYIQKYLFFFEVDRLLQVNSFSLKNY